MPISYHLIFILSWISLIVYGFMCAMGPLIASNLSPTQKLLQDWLSSIIVSGVIVIPLIYLSAISEPRWRYVKYVLLFPFGFIPGVSTVLKSFWLCLVSPAFLVVAIATTVAFFTVGGNEAL
jgi:hypothetical protein